VNNTERKLSALALSGGNSHIELLPLVNFHNRDNDDDYVYHLTDRITAGKILKYGFKTSLPDLMNTYTSYARGKVFFTERSGIDNWLEKIEGQSLKSGRWAPSIMLLRVAKHDIQHLLHADAINTKEFNAKCYYITQSFK